MWYSKTLVLNIYPQLGTVNVLIFIEFFSYHIWLRNFCRRAGGGADVALVAQPQPLGHEQEGLASASGAPASSAGEHHVLRVVAGELPQLAVEGGVGHSAEVVVAEQQQRCGRQRRHLVRVRDLPTTAILMDLIESEFSENSAVLPRTWGPKMPLFSKHFCDNWQIPAS